MANSAFKKTLGEAGSPSDSPAKQKNTSESLEVSGDGLLDGSFGMDEDEEDDGELNFGTSQSSNLHSGKSAEEELDRQAELAKKVDESDYSMEWEKALPPVPPVDTRRTVSEQPQYVQYEQGGRGGMMSNTSEIGSVILDYVCKCTISNLKESYQSKIYTEEFTKGLFDKYLAGKANSDDPLFKALISECIDNKVEDPYLKDLTIQVLEHIHVN